MDIRYPPAGGPPGMANRNRKHGSRMKKLQVRDVLAALDSITGGRLVKGPACYAGKNPFVVTKSSGIPGKAVTEMPGLVWGDPEMDVARVGVMMTLTESAIELAGATGVNCLIAHHPVADAANTGGVLARDYLNLYKIAVIELHEAFHGLHPGIAWLHGSKAHKVDIKYGGVSGKIVWFGEAIPEVPTLGALIDRLGEFMGTDLEERILKAESAMRDCSDMEETSVSARAKIYIGNPDDKLGRTIIAFPHTGFSADDLARAVEEYPADTLVCTISRPLPDDALVDKARELGLKLVAGNSHAMEILENGVPLAYAIARQLPGLDVRLFRERMISCPLEHCGNSKLLAYARDMAEKYLPKP